MKSEKKLDWRERLRNVRLDLQLTQDDLAEKWGYSSGNYIYILESGANNKPFPGKLMAKVEDLERIATLKNTSPGDGDSRLRIEDYIGSYKVTGLVRKQCLEHLGAFLENCEDDESRLHWTLIELRSHFPLDKWKNHPARPRKTPDLDPVPVGHQAPGPPGRAPVSETPPPEQRRSYTDQEIKELALMGAQRALELIQQSPAEKKKH